MDIGQIGDDGWTSLRTCWRAELWLPAGFALAAVAYLLWIGLSGAAVGFLAEAVAGDIGVSPWTSATDFGVALLAILWVVGPAALAVVLTVGHVTNARGKLRTTYRLRHPLLLLAPPVTLLAAGYGLLVATGAASLPVVAVLLAGAVLLAVRTTAYAYRVFSLSVPLVAWSLLFATAGALAVATLVLGGLAVGREALVGNLLAGLATRLGHPALATAHVEAVTVAAVDVPLLIAVVVAVPVGGTVAYVGIQVAWSLVMRLYGPTVPRPELRTGQRYPRFARPTTSARPRHVGRTDGSVGQPGSTVGASGDANAGPAGTAADTAAGAPSNGESAGSSGTADSDDEVESDGESADAGDRMDEVTHTRVFTPPEDADVAMPDEFDDPPDRETTVTDGSVDRRCPACGATLDHDDAACPDCGEDLETA